MGLLLEAIAAVKLAERARKYLPVEMADAAVSVVVDDAVAAAAAIFVVETVPVADGDVDVAFA
jgi:hypothetical protein